MCMESFSKVGNSANKKCQCKKGYSGNGFQCKDDKTGDWATNPSGEVESIINHILEKNIQANINT